MTTTLIIIGSVAWCYIGLSSAIHWENRIKRANGNENQTWRKHQVGDLKEFMLYGPASYLAGWMKYKNEKK